MYVGENGYYEIKPGSDLFFGSEIILVLVRVSEYLRRDTAEIKGSETNVQRVNIRKTER
jgi:hypothetical protein